MSYRASGIVVIVLVAGHACCVRQVVIVVDVAIGAQPGRHGVQSSQWEAGGVVIESCIRPGTRTVALRTGLRKTRSHVVRIRCALEVLQVT